MTPAPGPLRQPSNVRQLRTGKDVEPPAVSSSVLPAPRMPAWLTDPVAKAAWSRIVKALEAHASGYLSSIDSEQLALVVANVPLAIAALKSMRKGSSYEVVTRDAAHKDTVRKHPAVQVFRDASTAYLQGMDRLGLTPRVRRALDLGLEAFVNDDDEDDDLFDT